MDTLIYKILPEALWRDARTKGRFEGAGIDLKDGFIHFSTAGQVRRTAELYFADQQGLLLVAVDGAMLGSALRYEPSRDGDLFPHLYANLPLDAVVWEKPLPLGPDGAHEFPENLGA